MKLFNSPRLPLLGAILLSLAACNGNSTTPSDAAGDSSPMADGARADGSDVPSIDVVTQDVPPRADTVDAMPPLDVTPGTDVIVPSDGSTVCPYAAVRALTLPSDTATGTLAGASRNVSTTCTTAMGTGGPEDFYMLHVTASTMVQITTTASIDTVLAIRRQCDQPLSEIACNNDRDGTTHNALVRAQLDPGDYYVVVDQLAFGVGGPYTLQLTTLSSPANSICTSATPVHDGTVLTTDDTTLAVDTSGACTAAGTGALLYYSITIPAGGGLRVSASPPLSATSWDPTIRVMSGCSTVTCLAYGNTAPNGSPELLTYYNRTSTDQAIVIAVGSADATGGPFALNVHTIAPRANATCSTAVAVSDGTSLSGQDLNFAHDTVTACLPGASGPVLYYSATIPAGQTLSALATATSAITPTVRILSACGATTCLADSGPTPNTAAAARLTNSGTTDEPIIIAVGGASASEVGTFGLQITLRAPATNSTCTSALPLVDGQTETAVDLTGAIDTITACLNTSTGPVLYYSAVVPPNSTLAVNAVASNGAMWDPVVRVLGTCGAATCLANSGTPGNGTATARYTNLGAAAQTVIVAIGGADGTGAAFDLAVSIGSVPYIETSIPTACDDMTAAPVLDGPVSDDSNSDIIALPFSLAFMGETETYFSVTSNGFIQVYPSAVGAQETQYTNAPIPTMDVPNGVIAPFWDDLTTPVDGTNASVNTQNFITAPAHFTVQWTNWTFYQASQTSAHLTFQAKIFADTGVIEYHYCTMTTMDGNTQTHGSSATIGVENASGLRGYQHSFNMANSISTTNAIRLTPSP